MKQRLTILIVCIITAVAVPGRAAVALRSASMLQPGHTFVRTAAIPSAGFDLMPPGGFLRFRIDRISLAPGASPPVGHSRSWQNASFSLGWDHRSSGVTTPLGLSGLALIPLDAAVHRYTSRHWQGAAEDRLSGAGNEAGSVGGFVAVGATYLVGTAHERDTAMMAASAALESGFITEALKWAVGRRRPSGGSEPSFSPFHGGASFPSGHATFSFSLATVYAHRYPRFAPLAYALASWVGLSRIQSNHHFLTDVLAGAAIGINSGQRAVDGKISIQEWRF